MLAELQNFLKQFTQQQWQRQKLTVFSLNDHGTNRFSCTMQPGFDDNDLRTSEEELEANAELISHLPEILTQLYVVTQAFTELAQVANRLVSELPSRRDWLDPSLEKQMRELLKKAVQEA